jgi:ribosomal protein L15E
MNALKLGMQRSGFRGREDTMKLIEALEGLEMTEGDALWAKRCCARRTTRLSTVSSYFEMKDGKYKILEVVPKEKTILPPACKFA